jgi:proteasome lid subunit RPN8/RPN11
MLSFPRAIFQQMITDCIERRPSEAIGLLGGADRKLVRVCLPLTNVFAGPRYWADPFSQWRALQELKRVGLIPIAVYHSHPEGGVTLSAEDRKYARDLALAQVVVSVRHQHITVAVFNVASNGDVSEIPFEIN